MTYSVRIDDISRAEWAQLAAAFDDHNFCQMWDYAAARADETRSLSSHVAVLDGNRPVMMCECRVKKLPLIPAGVAYASGGPLMRAKDTAAELGDALCLIRNEYVGRRGLSLRLAPRVFSGDDAAVNALFAGCGFARTPGLETYRTIVLDLAAGEESLRKGLRQKWRNALNRSAREGLSVRMGTGADLFEDFATLYSELLERKGFDVPLGAEFYRRLQAVLPDREKLDVTLAYKDSRPVAGHVASMLGDTCVYLLGASNSEGLATKAAYLLQWEVIREALRRGMKLYDLGGIDPDSNPGVYHFKSGLGGREIVTPGPFEAAASPARKHLVDMAQRAYALARTKASHPPAAGRGARRADGRLASVLCFGGEDWWYHNRGHIDMQIMKRFAASVPVLYVNSIVMRKWNIGEGRMFLTRLKRKAKSIFRGSVEVAPRFHVYSPASLPVHHLAWAKGFNDALVRSQVALVMGKAGVQSPLVWVACPTAADTALSLRRGSLVYQRTDRYEDYPGVDREMISRYDLLLKREADVTIYVSHALMARESARCRRAFFLDHGVDYELFAGVGGDAGPPDEMAGLAHPIVGYFGDIDAHIVDVEMLEELTGLLPLMTFVFVGTSTVDTGTLAGRPNVRMIPRQPYEAIPRFGKCFDVAIMPWRRNEWIEYCNPVKLKEYLALGKPVVSTPFSELDYYDGVVTRATGAGEFAAAIESAIAEDSPEKIEARRKRVADITWDSRAALALEAVGFSVKQ